MDSKEEANADRDRRDMAAENSDTVAQNKKRARRVSFAEITSVHFFDRDEEFNETSLAAAAKMVDDSPAEYGFGGLSERSKEYGGEDDGDENLDHEVMEMQRSFLRPVGSPSSGGSTLGSASSNDEDNFFGPVSANFIRPGRLSDSAASDDNHDMTMDSTAFSMHFRSLAGSESGIDLKTPTGGKLFFEEKTPIGSNKGSSMDFTSGEKPVLKSFLPATEVSANQSSNDMSLVGENPNRYDYGKLSPGLDALLAESRKNLHYVNASDNITSVSPKRNIGHVSSPVDHDNGLVILNDSVRVENGKINSISTLNEDRSDACFEFGNANGAFSPKRFLTSTLGAIASTKESHNPNSSPYQLSKDVFDSSLVPSTPSTVKQQQTLPTAVSPSKFLGLTSPLPQKCGSLLSNGSNEHHLETETSIQKSISKLEFLEKAALSSAFSAKVDNSTIKSLDFFKSPNVMEKNHDISSINFMEASVNEEKLASGNRSTKRNLALGMYHAGVANLLEKSLSHSVNGKSSNSLYAKSISAGKSKSEPTAASPSKNTWTGNNLIRSLFTSKISHGDLLMTETESLLAETAFGEGEKEASPKFVPSPGRVLDKNLPVSPDLLPSKSMELRSRLKQMADFNRGRDLIPGRDPAHVNPPSAIVVSERMNGEFRSPFVEVNRLNLIELRTTYNRETDMHNGKEIIQTTGNFSTPAKENQFQAVNLDIGDVTNRDLPGAESRMVSHESVSSSACMNLDQPCSQKSPAGSPSRKEPDDKQQSKILSPRTIQMSGGLGNYSANKRNIELLLKDAQHRTQITVVERSPKFQKSGNYDLEKIVYSTGSRTKSNGQEKQKLASACSIQAYNKFSEDMKILISESADKLNSKMVDRLGNMLVHQQKLKVYQMLQHEIAPQSAIVHDDLQLEKIAETKSLLHRVVFEKAKLLLKHVKRDEVLKRLDLLSSRMHESQSLTANIVSLPLPICSSTVGHQSPVNLTKEHEVCHDKLTTMRQTLEDLDRKILTLTRMFHARCKLKAEPGVGETITLVIEHLTKKTSCRLIRLDMQKWVILGMTSVNGQHKVILNHLDFIIQSINIIVGPTSSVRSSFKLNETNITKNFPSMDACVAFGFVFNSDTAHKYAGAKTLVQETQVTSSLLGSVLDVVEEVQIAHIELQNLTDSRFSSPSVDRLHLMLCFINFHSGRKVSLTFDLSCLKRGLYPSEILPLSSPTHMPIPDKTRNAIKDVKAGYTRILRLCRCVSGVVQASAA